MMYKIIRRASKLTCIGVSSNVRALGIALKYEQSPHRSLHTSPLVFAKKYGFDADDVDEKNKRLPMLSLFDVSTKDKETFNRAIEIYIETNPRRKGHVEFIYAALKYMEEFGVDHDLESYKNVLQVLPKDKFIPQNVFQSEFMYYPKQQQCAVEVLDMMERRGIIPDTELGQILVSTFGKTGIPVRKYMRMMYWMPKFKNANPWPVPRPTPKDAFTLAKLAIERITSVDNRSVVSVLYTKDVADSLDETWIVSGQSPVQQNLIESLPDNTPVYVEGPFLIWLRDLNVQYFILRADPSGEPEPEPVDPDDVRNLTAPWVLDQRKPPPRTTKSVHEQDDGTILCVCATGTSTRDSLLSWIRLLEQNGNPRLGSLPVLFRLRSSSTKGEIVSL